MSGYLVRPGNGWLLLAILGLSACATHEFAPSSPEALTQVAANTLERAVYVQTLTDRCERIGGNAASEARAVRERWLTQHWASTAAADRHYTLSLQQVTFNHLGQPLALEAVYLTQNTQRRALNTLELERRSHSNQQITCVRELERIASSATPLVSDSEQPYLDYLLGLYPSEATRDTAPIPSLAAHIPLDLAPGRSFYTLEEQAKTLCPSAELIVLHNQWPSEAYASYCAQEPLAFISCEWGHCQEVNL